MTQINPNTRRDVSFERLIAGGSLYPPPDVPVHFSRRMSLLIIVGCAIAAWAVTLLMVWPVLM